MEEFLQAIDWRQIISSFVFLIAIIDPVGNMPVTMSIEARGQKIKPLQVCMFSLFILIAFLFIGEWILVLFGVDVHSFAVAGSLIIFIMGLEMVLDVEIFKNKGPEGTGSLVPLAFPMYAGPGAFTAILSISAEYSTINLILSIIFNMVALYLVLRFTHFITKYCGDVAIYIIRKFFGIIILAIAIKLFTTNFNSAISPTSDAEPARTEQVVSILNNTDSQVADFADDNTAINNVEANNNADNDNE